MKKNVFGWCFVVGGVLLLFFGVVLLKAVPEAEGIMAVLPYVCLGLGCGIFGHGVGTTVTRWSMKKYPDLQKQADIESKDERNVAVANSAKAKAFDLMLYLFGALMLTYVLMQAELAVIILLVGAYIIVTGVFIFYLNKYQREM